MYVGGVIKHTGVLAVGGDHVSNDLAYGLKVPLSRAEKLKLEHGSAIVDEAAQGRDRTPSPMNLACRIKTINVGHLQRIMALRLEEIFQLIAQDLEQAGLSSIFAPGFFSPAAARASRTSRSSPRRFCKCPCPSARPIPSAASSPRWTSPNSPPPSASSNSARSKTRKREGKFSLTQGIKGVFGRLLQK